MWHAIKSPDKVPSGQELRLAVMDRIGNIHALAFPCRRTGGRWVDVRTERTVEIDLTHWMDWSEHTDEAARVS